MVLADPEGNEFCVIEPGNNFLADCGFIGALACDGSQEVGYFWSEALGWPLVWDQDQETAIRSPHGGPKITWGGPPLMPKTGKNRLHFDLAPPVDGDQQAEVDRLVSLGATRIDIGQGEVSWVVMADPDGNEFCVLAPQLTRALPTAQGFLSRAHTQRMQSPSIAVRSLRDDDRDWVLSTLTTTWGSVQVARRGELIDIITIPWIRCDHW